jgi:hypothetical protein
MRGVVVQASVINQWNFNLDDKLNCVAVSAVLTAEGCHFASAGTVGLTRRSFQCLGGGEEMWPVRAMSVLDSLSWRSTNILREDMAWRGVVRLV